MVAASVTVGALCAAWYVLSSASNVVSKLALAELPFPLTVAAAQLAAVCACSVPVLAVCGIRSPEFPRGYRWRMLLPLAFAKVLTTLCSQISIWKVPVSYAHTVKATTPLWTAGLAWLLFGERQTRGVQVALVVIALGVGVASATEMQFDAGGLGAALAAAALLALQHIYSKRALRDTGVHPLRLLAELARLSLALVVPAWVAWDWRAVLAAPVDWGRAGPLLGAAGVLSWLQALAAFSVLSRVSPLTYAVASAAKRAAVVFVSLGVLAYNRAKVQARRSDTSARLLPV